MTVTPEVTKMWSRDSFNIQSDRGMRKNADIVNAYQITCPATYTEEQISNLADLPATDSRFDGLPDMRLLNRSFQRLSPIYWICICTYKGTNRNPIEEPPDIEWSDAASTEAIDEDWSGNPIVTVNGEPIEGVTMEISDVVLNVSRNFRFFNPALFHQYRLSVNSDVYQGFAPGLGRLVKYNAKQVYNGSDGGHWAVSASIKFRYPYRTTPAKAWHARVRHEGFYVKENGIIVRAVDKEKQPTTRPVLLNQIGEEEINPENAHWLEFQRYQPLPYSALGLL